MNDRSGAGGPDPLPLTQLQFGEVSVNVGTQQALLLGTELALGKLSFRLLVCLARHAPNVVSTDELMREVWDRAVVSEETVVQRVKLVRDALTSAGAQQDYIVTVRGRGYRLAVPVELSSATEKGEQDGSSQVIRAIAVLPFADLSAEQNQGHVSDGIHDEIISQLSKIRSLRVTSRTSVMPFRNTSKSMRELAEIFQVDSILEGSVRFARGRVRATAQLIAAGDDTHLWAESYDRALSMDSLLSIQVDIAERITQVLRAEFTQTDLAKLARSPTSSLEAYNHFLLARHQLERMPASTEYPAIVEHYQRAIEIDPEFVWAHVGLGWVYSGIGSMLSDRTEAHKRAQGAAQRALAIDPDSPGARELGANIAYWFSWDTSVESIYKGLLRDYPDYEGAYASYAMFLSSRLRFDEALAMSERHLSISPGNTFALLMAALRYSHARQFDRAIELSNQVIALDPQSFQATLTKAACHLFLGDVATCIDMLTPLSSLAAAPVFLRLATALAVAGKSAEARAMIAEYLESLPPGKRPHFDLVAQTLIAVGDVDQAFELIERAVEMKAEEMLYFHVTPLVDAVRGDARFQEYLRALGLASQ